VRTDIHYLVPFTADGLNPALNVRATTDGACTFPSSLANSRPDAWGCTSADNEIYDPCFENPLTAPEQPGEVVCFDSPFGDDVVIMKLTAPLEHEKETPTTTQPGDPAASNAASEIAPWDLPWALELANGDRCSLLRGTLIPMAGKIEYYGCEQQGM